jgi:hypothetical protein
VSSDAIPMLYYLGKVYVKRLYCFKYQRVWTMKRYKYFYAKNLNRQSDCIISNPRIFKGEAIQVLLRKKVWVVKVIVSFQTPELLKMKQYKYFYREKNWIDKAIGLLQTLKAFSDEAIQLLLLLLLFEAIVWAPYFCGGGGFTDFILP